ncbi:MAG: nucleotide exchange factor GrpE [Bacteroidota bacterium]
MSKEQETKQQEELLPEDVATPATEEQTPDEPTDNEPVEADDPVAKLQAENEELRNKLLRRMAEFDNLKKRTGRERIELLGQASRDTLSAILPALDDFDRAINLPEEQKNSPAFQEGMELVYQKLFNALKQRGLEPMDSNGEVFDPELHEALTEIPAPSEELKGKIVDTIERGYMLNGKIIRHAKVVTGK